MKANPPFAALRRQRGAALFVALIMLILLTLLAVAASQVSLLQERMSGSFRAQNIAFQRAEGAVAEKRGLVSNPLLVGDQVSLVPIGLSANDESPWRGWLDTFSSRANINARYFGDDQSISHGVGEDRARKVSYYVVSSQQKDADATDDSVAAWASVQTIYVY